MSTIKPTVDKPDTIEAYVTKYALTTGVYKVTGHVTDTGATRNGKAFLPDDCSGLLFHGQWHVTDAAAIEHVKAMVKAKRKALAKQIEALAVIEENVKAGKLPMVNEEEQRR